MIYLTSGLQCMKIEAGVSAMFFGKKKKEPLAVEYNKEGKRPVIRASICTGEKTAGFKDMKTGQIEELMLITGKKDLERFMKLYGVESEEIETVW